MLVQNLFTFEEVKFNESRITAVVRVNADNGIYSGHFEGNPITPGVLQIQLVQELAALAMNRKLVLTGIGRCKFLAIWNPNETPEINVELDCQETEEGLRLTTSGNSGETVFFKLSATYL